MNIDFDGSNSSQISVYNAKLGDKRYRTVYCMPKSLSDLKAFLEDVRTMPEEEWLQVLTCIAEKNPQKENKNDAE